MDKKSNGEEIVEVLTYELVKIRIQQLLINQLYLAGRFKIPIHLALGHEQIALSLTKARDKGDDVVLSHRNLHYQLALGGNLSEIVKEFFLQEDGLANGKYGSMNLINPKRNVTYTSSILGNNLPVSVGIAYGQKVSNQKNVTWVVTGDGAIEEGAFVESLLLAKSIQVPLIIVIEDNEWSLGTKISERRSPIDLEKLAKAYGAEYVMCGQESLVESMNKYKVARSLAIMLNSPVVIHSKVTTLGGRWVEDLNSVSGKRYINYHAGPVQGLKDNISENIVLSEDDILAKNMSNSMPIDKINKLVTELSAEIAWTI